jgi:hypothetical protein
VVEGSRPVRIAHHQVPSRTAPQSTEEASRLGTSSLLSLFERFLPDAHHLLDLLGWGLLFYLRPPPPLMLLLAVASFLPLYD